MNGIFLKGKENNNFDKIDLDLDEIYRKYPINKKINPKSNQVNFNRSIFHRIYRNKIIPLSLREYIWFTLRTINLDRSWLNNFSYYWRKVIKGRPFIGVEDIFFLKNTYRIKFQDNQIPEDFNKTNHLKAWQRPELLYQLLQLVCKSRNQNELDTLRVLRKYKPKFRSMLEFGCAIAPITTNLYDFFKPAKDTKIFISDIQTIAFHYACFKFRNCSNVIPILLRPENEYMINLPQKVDVIFCMDVFEHLYEPYEIIKRFYESLNKDSILIFDYLKSPGGGMNTIQAIEQRDKIIDYIAEKFEIIYGKLSKEDNVGLTIAKKLN